MLRNLQPVASFTLYDSMEEAQAIEVINSVSKGLNSKNDPKGHTVNVAPPNSCQSNFPPEKLNSKL